MASYRGPRPCQLYNLGTRYRPDAAEQNSCNRFYFLELSAIFVFGNVRIFAGGLPVLARATRLNGIFTPEFTSVLFAICAIKSRAASAPISSAGTRIDVRGGVWGGADFKSLNAATGILSGTVKALSDALV